MTISAAKNPVMIASALIVLTLAVSGAIAPEAFGSVAKKLLLFTTTSFGWLYLLAVFAMVVFLVGLALSRYGAIRLGADDSRPEFSLPIWIAMLFSAGFGAGLAIGFLQFRRKRDGLVSTALEPVLGERAGTKAVVDSLAVIATVMGIATSLGLGVLQIGGGLSSLQTASLVAALPFTVLLILLMIAIVRMLRDEPLAKAAEERAEAGPGGPPPGCIATW